MKDSTLAVTTFLAKGDSTVVQIAEFDPEGSQVLNPVGTVAQDFSHDLGVAETVSRLEGIRNVFLDVILGRGNSGNTALGIVGI